MPPAMRKRLTSQPAITITCLRVRRVLIVFYTLVTLLIKTLAFKCAECCESSLSKSEVLNLI